MNSALKPIMALLLLTLPVTCLYAGAPKDYKHMAIAYTCAPCGFNGWSVGGGVGVNAASGNVNMNNTTAAVESPYLLGPPGTTTDSVNRATVTKFSAMGSLFANYGYLRDIYYAGISAGFNFPGARMLQTNTTTSSNITVTDTGNTAFIYYLNTLTNQAKITRSWWQPFLDIKLGGLITPETLAYGIIGTSFSSATLKTNTNYYSSGYVSPFGGTPPATGFAIANSSFVTQTTKYFFGFRIGAGMEVLLTQNFGVGADYVYTFYPSIKNNRAVTGNAVTCDTLSGCTTVASTLTNYTRVTLNDQQAMAKFTYHFC